MPILIYVWCCIIMKLPSFLKDKKTIGFFAGLLIAAGLYFINPFSADPKANKTLFAAVLMVCWWVSGALPLAATALIPVILFPLLNIASLKTTTALYGDPMIFLFMGGFFLALAIEKWGLHKRIALGIINSMGTNGNRIILGFILATGFLSMWLSNTATTMMMFPIAASVIHVMSQSGTKTGVRNFSVAVLLSIAYASNIGGISTLIGTPPNTAYANIVRNDFKYNIDFLEWMLICIPIAAILLFFLYFTLTRFLFPNHMKQSSEMNIFIKGELKAMGRMTGAERKVLIIFIITALLWITKDLFIEFTPVKKDEADAVIAMLGGLALFAIPSGKKENDENERLLEWPDTKKMAWGILLMFGGGLALANAMKEAGLINMIGNAVSGWQNANLFVLILAVTALSVFLSELMSNLAQVTVLAPVVGIIAVNLNVDPLLLGIPMALGASCAGMMPMGTPPNAIVFSSGDLKLKEMMRAGFVMNLISIIVITLVCYFVLPLVMHIPETLLQKK
jgi:solute carrier family 13 (sodium-dependent dicarboxylate transporter), member 2/3/5